MLSTRVALYPGSFVSVLEGKHIRRLVYKTQPSIEFPSELSLRETAIGERLAVDQDAWWEQQPTFCRELLTLRRRYIERGKRKPVLSRKALQDVFGLLAESTVLLREEQDVKTLMVLSIEQHSGRPFMLVHAVPPSYPQSASGSARTWCNWEGRHNRLANEYDHQG